MPSAGKAFQRSSAPGRKFAHTRPQSIRKITAITLKQEQLSISSSGTQVASGSGLCSETWAWMRAIYFHLVFWRIWHFSKNNAEKMKQYKAHGFGICCLFSVAVRPHVLAMFLYVVCVCLCLFVCVLWNAENMHGSLHVVFMLCFFWGLTLFFWRLSKQ